MSSIVRLEADPGLLSNRLIALEIGVGLAHLSNRRLSMPWGVRIGDAPGSRPAGGAERPGVLDLWDVPVAVVPDEEWEAIDDASIAQLDWGPFTRCVYLADTGPIPHPGVRAFAAGRTRFVRLPDDEAHHQVAGRPLCFASWFFHATGERRRELFDVLGGVALGAPYTDYAASIVAGLGRYNVAHVRRTDLVKGVRAYAAISPARIADTLGSLLPADELLLIATEADADSALFDPLRERFPHLAFVNDLVLGDHGEGFRSLPYHEDNVLGAVTQEIAVSAERFVGTMASTFTAVIHRRRRARDREAPFWYTADFTPPGPRFVDGEFHDVQPGRYSWNRIGLQIDPENFGWQREWPEAVASPDDEPDDSGLDVPGSRRGEHDEPIRTVVCTDTNPYGDWQCQFQEHTWRRASQPGDLIRLVACPDGERPPVTAHSRVVTTSARNGHPDAPEEYAGFNRLWSLQEWLDIERPSGTVLVLDADMVFRAPIRTTAAAGEIVVQEWHAFDGGGLPEWLAGAVDVAAIEAAGRSFEPLTWPMLIDAADLAELMPRWIELTAVLRRTTAMWESDMFALVAAVAESQLDVRYETLGAWMPWPESFVAGAPTIHYCQPVLDRAGREIWYKQSYSPWEPLGVAPNTAAFDYSRDLLHLLDEFIRTQRS